MQRIGLLHHPKIPESIPLAEQAAALLTGLDVSVWLASAWDEATVEQNAGESDALVTFGGDGTIVRTARVTAGHHLPILGVNMGRLGFLAAVQPPELEERLTELAEGEFEVEERAMLRAELVRDGQLVDAFDAVNDVVVSRGRIARVIRVDVQVDDQFLTQYVADGVIVATPTGSTAYALAAGGPILDPRLNDMLLKPIAPHLTVASAVVLPASAKLRLAVSSEYEAICSIDGQVHVSVADGDLVAVTGSAHVCRFVRPANGPGFYQTLLERLC